MNVLSTQEAPGELEKIRLFMNTWRIPNDSRIPIDLISSDKDLLEFQLRHFPLVLAQSDLSEALQLRNDLRDTLGTRNVQILNDWLKDYQFSAMFGTNDSGVAIVKYASFDGKSTLCGELLRVVLESVAQNQWQRMKECPDCKWVHYDNTKNGSKIWCGMAKSGENGRACGTISKVKRWRERHKGEN